MTDSVLTEGGSDSAERGGGGGGGRRGERETGKMREGGDAHVNTYK